MCGRTFTVAAFSQQMKSIGCHIFKRNCFQKQISESKVLTLRCISTFLTGVVFGSRNPFVVFVTGANLVLIRVVGVISCVLQA